MATISASYTDSQENLDFFARAEGYRDTIFVVEEFTDYDPRGIPGTYTRTVEQPNPETLEEFLTRRAGEVLLAWISGPISNKVDSDALEMTEAQKQEYIESLKSNLHISIS